MGIGAGIAAAIASVGEFFAATGAAIAGGIGLGSATLGGISAGALIGGGLEGAAIGGLGGGAISAVTGKPILPGIAQGALVGGAVGGLGPAIGGLTGLGGVAGDVLAGAGAGALGGGVLPGGAGAGAGALSGAGAGLVAGLSGLGGPASASPTTGGPGASAAGIAAPASLPDPAGNAFGAVTSDAAGGAAGGSAYGATSPFSTGDIYGGAGGATTGSSLSTFTSPSVTNAYQGLDLANVPASSGPSGTTLGASAPGASFSFNGAPPVAGPVDAATAGFPVSGTAVDAGAIPASLPSGVSPTVSPSTSASALFTPTPDYGTSVSTGAGGATAGNSIGNFVHDPSFGNLAEAASKNSGLLLGAGTLGLDLIKGNQTPPGQSQITDIAGRLNTQSQQLQSYLNNGTLPPGVSTALSQAGASAEAAIRSQYAARGMSGSSAEAQDIANVHNTIVSQGANIATQLLNTGVSEANLSASLYGQIMQQSLQQDQQLSNAFATLASSAARPTIQIAGTTSG